jgi:hypothetical protein
MEHRGLGAAIQLPIRIQRRDELRVRTRMSSPRVPVHDLKDADLGGQVTVTTAAPTLVYRIVRIGLSPKAANSLPSWASDSSVPNRLVLVTCEYEQGDTSTDNLVVVARLQRS